MRKYKQAIIISENKDEILEFREDELLDLSMMAYVPLYFCGNIIIEKRENGEFKNKAFWLDGSYDWEIARDYEGAVILIPKKQ